MQRKITPGHRRGAKHPPAAIVLEDGRCGLGTPLPHPDFLISDNSDVTLNGPHVLVPMSLADDPDIRRGRA